MLESTEFNILSNINFFKNFQIMKIFRTWKKNQKKKYFDKVRKKITRNVYYCKPAYSSSIFDIKNLLSQIHQYKMVDFSQWQQKQVDFEEFKTYQKDVRAKVSREYDNIFEEILQIISKVVNKIRESKIENYNLDLKHNFVKNLVKHKPLNLIKKEKIEKRLRKNLSEYDFRILGKFIRFINYLSIENLIDVNQNSLLLLKSELFKERKNGLFTTSPILNNQSVSFIHKEKDIIDSIGLILEKNIKVVSDVPKILGNSAFNQYVSDILKENETLSCISPNIHQIIQNSNIFQNEKLIINKKITKDFRESKKKVENNFNHCQKIENERKNFKVEDWIKEKPSLEKIKDRLMIMKGYRKDSSERIKDYFYGILHVDSQSIRNILTNFINDCLKKITEYLYSFTKIKVAETIKEFNECNNSLTIKITDLENFSTLIKNYKNGINRKSFIENRKDEIEKMYKLLNQVNFSLMREDKSNRDDILKIAEDIDRNLSAAEDKIRTKKDFFKRKYDSFGETIREDVKKLEIILNAEKYSKTDTPVREALRKLEEISEKIEIVKENYTIIEEYSNLMEFELEDPLPSFPKLENQFNSINNLWRNYDNYQKKHEEWYKSNFLSIDTKKIKSEITNLATYCEENSNTKNDVMINFSQRVEEDLELIPIIMALGNKDLQDKHWNEIFKIFENGYNLKEQDSFNLEQLLEIGVAGKLCEIEDISNKASGEEEIKKNLKEIRDDWYKKDFTVKKYRDFKDKYILVDTADIFEKLESDLMKIQGIMNSKYIKEIKEEVEQWEKKLLIFQETLEEWLLSQKQWIYLENVFSADDIQKQLPSEYNKFYKIDSFFKDTMQNCYKKRSVIENIPDRELYEKFVEINKNLENIQKMLEDYLDLKRNLFPRFYFLSNDELLEIFSQTRNPQAVQPYIEKCFDNIKKIKFIKNKETNKEEIEAMISAEPEKDPEIVKFKNIVQVKGPVENWLLDIEKMMKETLYNLLIDCLKESYNKSKILDSSLYFKYPAQIVLAVNMIKWTFGIENAIKENNLTNFSKEMDEKIKNLVELIKNPLTIGQREIIKNLIILDVHNRDITTKLLNHHFLQIKNFNYQKQLRYYHYKENQKSDCFIKQTNTIINYGYEYLGNSTRLVITPLTDKCYLTLTSAFSLNFGGSLSGPAGTGKTETTKDLGKALAVICLVFNCSDGLTNKTMAQFFCGLAQNGAWACFDEFNRIEIDVLSVIAQQILCIQNALRENKSNFDFEGRFIKLDRNFGVFITMNPGYVGRTELPDNLKKLFRPVAMMIPNYSLIAEIILFSEGFLQASELARKMVTLYKLSSEQLSKKKHYDFGMRAVKSVLTMAGTLRRRNTKMCEKSVLLKAMKDSNLPKFSDEDIPLFDGITEDLFPNLISDEIYNQELKTTIHNFLDSQNLQCDPKFINKVLQFYEVNLIRHGTMIVGTAGSGKSTLIKTLENSLEMLNDSITSYKLNPKSLTQKELFGYNDQFTGTFIHGVVSKIILGALEDEKKNKKWFIFDGPVDADWIENLNTVLDENRMLCLPDGKRIKLPKIFSMLFEVENLDVASPATVSRCGMIYLDNNFLDPFLYYKSWKNIFSKKMKERCEDIFTGKDIVKVIEKSKFFQKIKELLVISLKFVRENCKEIIPSIDLNLIQNCLDFFESNFFMFLEHLNSRIQFIKNKKAKEKFFNDLDIKEHIFLLFGYSLTWSIGGNLTKNSKSLLNKKLRMEIVKNSQNIFKNCFSIFDFFYNFETFEIENWKNKIIPYKFDNTVPYFKILIETTETVQINKLLSQILYSKRSAFINGKSGVGKTLIINNFLQGLDLNNYLSINSIFSAQTSTKNLQSIFLEKYTQKGKELFPKNNKKMIFFIDDLNMPKLDLYGSQPVNELLRQIIDHGGFYDLKKYNFRNVQNTVFITSCAPPSGGRNKLPKRLLRHFHMLHISELSEKSMELIYSSILKGYLSQKSTTKFFERITEKIVISSIELYNRLKNGLLPTPKKFHYTFNLRDLSKVFQGMLNYKIEGVNSKEDLVYLWIHEKSRVFQDRLINKEDRDFYFKNLKELCSNYLNQGINEKIVNDTIFSDFVDDEYKKIKDFQELEDKLYHGVKMYNLKKGTSINLVLFKEAIHHLCRIKRVLSLKRGNLVLIGLGGSGRQSLSKLASFMTDLHYYKIEIKKNYNELMWREDIKNLLKIFVSEEISKIKGVSFLVTNEQILHDSFLEDINNLLNNGEIPNLYIKEELEEIYSLTREVASKHKKNLKTKEDIWSYFVELVRNNLHIILTFSPVGSDFRDKSRQFPSIINCSTIDWFDKWSEKALVSVAMKTLKNDKELGLNEEMIKKVARISLEINKNVETESDIFFKQLRRKCYVTPSNFLDFLNLYSKFVKNQRNILPKKLEKYKLGLEKMKQTKELIEVLQKNIKENQKEMKIANTQNIELKKKIKEQKTVAEKKEKAIGKEAKEIEDTRNKVEKMRENCQTDLNEALPALLKAQNAAKNIDKQYVATIKTYKVVAKDIEMVLFAVNLIFGKNETWDEVKRFLGDINFLKKLTKLDPMEVSKNTWDKLKKKYLSKAEFDPKYLKEKVSEAVSTLADYCINMEIYYKKKKEVVPKEKKLHNAEKELKRVEAVMKIKFDELKEIQDKVDDLETRLKQSIEKEIDLNKKQELAIVHLARAEKLISGLKDETIRWEKISKTLSLKSEKIEGDNILLAGAVAYSGPFFWNFRDKMLKKWIEFINKEKVDISNEFSLSKIFSDDMTVRGWRLNGLPGDEFSTQNAILMNNSEKWPLLIDPQTQANKWIKNMKKDEIIVIKSNDMNIMRIMENAVRYGNSILIENVGEKIDSALEPILLKLIIKKNNGYIIKLNDKEIPYNNDFSLYLTTKLQNPHYLPETTIKVNLINFTVTELGLENQLLGEVVKIEKPELEEQKNTLIKQISDDNKQLYDLGEKILKLIIDVKGDILDDEQLINILEASKNTAITIKERMEKSKETNIKINQSRDIYRGIAERGSLLYFVIRQLPNIDPLYEFSLDYIIAFYIKKIKNFEEHKNNIGLRVLKLKKILTELVFKDICRGIFEKDKLMYSFMISVKIQMKNKLISQDQWDFFKIFQGDEVSEKKPIWIKNENTWKIIHKLIELSPNLINLISWLTDHQDVFKKILSSNNLSFDHLKSLPGSGLFTNFDKFLVLRCFRPEKLEHLITLFIKNSLNDNFLRFPSFDLNHIYKNSTPETPIIIILSQGADPIKNLKILSEEQNSSQVLNLLSLGRGMDEKAKESIKNAQLNGDWICLQNCHLCPSFLKKLQNICLKTKDQEIHENYRLFLTTSRTDKFPVEFLHSSLKITNEPARGIRAHLERIYDNLEENFDKDYEKPVFLKPLFFSLAMFHAVLLERRKYGPSGWNIPYKWMSSDFEFSVNQIKICVQNSKEVPFDMLSLMIGRIFYGGRVTDYNDEKLVESLLKGFFNLECLEKNYVYLPTENFSKVYKLPTTKSVKDVKEFIYNLPLSDEPGIFGLHDNAKITYDLQKCDFINRFLLNYEPTLVANNSDHNKEILKNIQFFQKILPKIISFKKLKDQDSFLIFRDQESERFNNLLKIIKSSLFELENSIKGLSTMSLKTEKMLQSFLIKEVPHFWSKNGFLSVKKLDAWFQDLIKRVDFFKKWHDTPNLKTYAFGSFFFPQGFITAVLQNHARKTKLPIDSLTLKTTVLKKYQLEKNEQGPQNGVYLKGLFLENAFFDNIEQKIVEARPKILFERMPLIWIEPIKIENKKNYDNIYKCPVYKTNLRQGKLSTTGHSTNFVMYLDIPIQEKYNVDHWLRRGTAIILQTKG